MPPALPRRERDAGGSDDLVGAHETLPVTGGKAPGAGGVEPRQLFAKPNAAQIPIELERLLPDSLGDCRNRRQTSLQRPEVKPGAADDDRQPTCPERRGDLVQCPRPPIGDRAALGSIEITVEPMRRLRLGRRVGTGGQDPEVAIGLLAVAVDDNAVQTVRQLER